VLKIQFCVTFTFEDKFKQKLFEMFIIFNNITGFFHVFNQINA